MSTAPSASLQPKVSRYYSRIFGSKLIGKRPTDQTKSAASPADGTTGVTAGTSSSAPAEKKYSASAAETNTLNAAEILRPVKTATAFNDVDYLMLYFSASWCPPCRAFTPQLSTFVKTINTIHLSSIVDNADRQAAAEAQQRELNAAAGTITASIAAETNASAAPTRVAPKVEVLFISGDQTYESAEEYFLKQHGDWLMVPFDEVKVRDKLLQRYGVRGFPTLVVLDAKTGKVITKEGATALRHDANGEEFPWRKESVIDRLAKEAVISKMVVTDADKQNAINNQLALVVGASAAATTTAATGGVQQPKTRSVDIKKLEHVALYFASHSSGPSRAFTPLLTAMYEDAIMPKFGESKTEIIFISMDSEEEHYNVFRGQMPWASLSFQHPLTGYLAQQLAVQSLPKLVTIRVSDGKVLNSDARAAVGEDTEDFNPDEEETETVETSSSTPSVKCGYPWARTRLPLVAPLVGSNDVVETIKKTPCVVLATNNASNKSVLVSEFKAAAEAAEESFAAASRKKAAEAGDEDEVYDPERNDGDDAEDSSKRVQFLISDASHVGSELLLERLAMVLQENLPPSGVACVFSFSMVENKSGGMLKTIHTKDIVDYTHRFVKLVEEAAAASPAKNLSALQPSTAPRRPQPQQQQQGGGNTAPPPSGSHPQHQQARQAI